MSTSAETDATPPGSYVGCAFVSMGIGAFTALIVVCALTSLFPQPCRTTPTATGEVFFLGVALAVVIMFVVGNMIAAAREDDRMKRERAAEDSA